MTPAEIALKERKQALEELKEANEKLNQANLRIKDQDAELEQVNTYNNKISNQLELSQKAERKAIDELIVFQTDYRKLEVDYLNQSCEVKRLKTMLERLKYTSQINVWLMEQHIGFVKQADEMAEVFGG